MASAWKLQLTNEECALAGELWQLTKNENVPASVTLPRGQMLADRVTARIGDPAIIIGKTHAINGNTGEVVSRYAWSNWVSAERCPFIYWSEQL